MSDPSKKDGFRCYKASGAIVATSSILIHSDPWACRSFVFCGPGLALRHFPRSLEFQQVAGAQGNPGRVPTDVG